MRTRQAAVAAAHTWLAAALRRVRGRVDRMRGVMMSMPHHVRPAFFYRRIRPYLAGWRSNPTLPDGVVYEGVGGDGEEGVRLRLSGGSAAQSSIIGAFVAFVWVWVVVVGGNGFTTQPHHQKSQPTKITPTAALDLYLGIDLGGPSAASGSRASYAFIRSMRAYMPRGHRRFLEALDDETAATDDVQQRGGQEGSDGDGDGRGGGARPSIRGYVAGLLARGKGAAVVAAYDACVEALVAFRRAHLSVVNAYILRQQQLLQVQGTGRGEGEGDAGLAGAAGGKGTGGTGVVDFLLPLKAETGKARLGDGNVR